VGASSIPGDYLLPVLITRFHAEHPGVRARLRISDSADTIEDLRRGDIELGVVGATISDPTLVFEPFASDQLVLVLPGTDEWKTRTEVTLRELRELPLVVREPGSGTRNSLERALARARLGLADLNVIAELGSTGSIKEAVKQGCGVSFVSELATVADRAAGTMRLARVRELGEIPRKYHTVVSKGRALSPLVRAFLDFLPRTVARARPAARPMRKSRD
jgi:DNA-binding transcriptional LysR family regulator